MNPILVKWKCIVCNDEYKTAGGPLAVNEKHVRYCYSCKDHTRFEIISYKEALSSIIPEEYI